MRPIKQILAAMASVLLVPTLALAAPTPADIAVVRDFVGRDRSYPPAAREEALREVDLLAPLLGDAARFELRVAHIAALADNGHSALLPPQWPSRYPRSPVHLGLFADGLFVIAAPADQTALVGLRVIAIDGRPWQEVREGYTPYQGGEQAFRDQFVTLFMEMPALLAAAGLSEDPDRLTLTLEDARGGRRTIIVRPAFAPFQGEAAFTGRSPLLDGADMLAPEERPLYLREPDQPFRLAFPAGIDAAYVQLKAVRGTGIDTFLAATLVALRARRPRNIVVDLRFNLGGDLNLARDFMQTLPGLARGGRVYAIVSGRTFSAAIASLGYLKQAGGARITIVGEPVGDRLEFWAEGNILRLPGLGGLLLYASERHDYRTGCPEPDCHASLRAHPIRVASLDPDIATPLSFSDYRAGRDPAMDAIAADIRRRRGAAAVRKR